MKNLFLFLILSFSNSLVYGAEKSMLARVTVYWRSESAPVAASNGASLREGNCAVDPKKIPYGSKILLAKEELTAVDTGTAVVNRRAARLSGRTPEQRNALVVDRYFDTKSQAHAWEQSHPHFMTLRVLDKNSPPPGNEPVSQGTATLSSSRNVACQLASGT